MTWSDDQGTIASLAAVVPEGADHRADREDRMQELLTEDMAEELLIEEVSIDGMCGVY